MAHSGISRGGALHQSDSARSLADTRTHEILYYQSYILALRDLPSGTCFLYVLHRGDILFKDFRVDHDNDLFVNISQTV
ncbi:hypothetical protein DPMN_060936 [Dreissena polymorpha]|uniref:Uncharacterized protein n=1 Tax=Dreissena polymorpha TaxID=45954 RepID=A0A9D4C643_DREPO|nr:hypothetical protein DPMN_060936 [Dreissena polymorpha]